MNLAELIDAHGAIVAAHPETDTLICWEDDENMFTVATGNQNGDYKVGDQYEGEIGARLLFALEEAQEVLADVLGEGDESEGD